METVTQRDDATTHGKRAAIALDRFSKPPDNARHGPSNSGSSVLSHDENEYMVRSWFVIASASNRKAIYATNF